MHAWLERGKPVHPLQPSVSTTAATAVEYNSEPADCCLQQALGRDAALHLTAAAAAAAAAAAGEGR